MKRLSVLFVVSAMVMALISCGKPDEQTQGVINKIDSIGVVDYDDEELIGQIENEYALLTSEQRKKVENIDVLVSAREEIDKLIAARPFVFTIANWESTLEDLVEIHGNNPMDEYESIYGGMCYVFNDINYKEFSGSIRYFYNENETLVNVKYEVDFSDSEETDSIYEGVFEEMKDKYGESEYQMDEDIFKADIWYRDTGNICISLIDEVISGKTFEIEYINKILVQESEKEVNK